MRTAPPPATNRGPRIPEWRGSEGTSELPGRPEIRRTAVHTATPPNSFSVRPSTQRRLQSSRLPQQIQASILDQVPGVVESDPLFLLGQPRVVHLLLRGAAFA